MSKYVRTLFPFALIHFFILFSENMSTANNSVRPSVVLDDTPDFRFDVSDIRVPFSRYLSNPEKYVGKYIQLIGFVEFRTGMQLLHENKSQFEIGDTLSSVLLIGKNTYDEKEINYLNFRVVLIEGTVVESMKIGKTRFGGTVRVDCIVPFNRNEYSEFSSIIRGNKSFIDLRKCSN